MLNDLIFWVNDGLSASLGVALGAAALWGVLSVLLSPCHLGTIPLIVGFVGSGGELGRGRGVALSFTFAGGMLLALTGLGVAVSTAGFAVSGFGALTNYALAAIFLVAGLHLLELITLPIPSVSLKPGGRTGLAAALGLGLVFGIGLSPCTFAFLAPILAASFSGAAAHPLRGFALFFAFGLGHCGVIGLAGSSTAWVQRYMDWNGKSSAITHLKRICGVLVLLAAGGLIYSA